MRGDNGRLDGACTDKFARLVLESMKVKLLDSMFCAVNNSSADDKIIRFSTSSEIAENF